MPPVLPKGTLFEVPRRGYKKYVAVVPNVGRVPFGDRRYEHYKDLVPAGLGGGRWSKKNHNDAARRKNYRSRHGAIQNANGKRSYKIRYTPAWFSYYFLW